MRLTSYNNATVVVEDQSKARLLIDPWVVADLYSSTWSPSIKATHTDILDITGSTNVFISHLHADHWDVETISLLPRSTHFFIPDFSFNDRVIKNKLLTLGFTEFTFIQLDELIQINNCIEISII